MQFQPLMLENKRIGFKSLTLQSVLLGLFIGTILFDRSVSIGVLAVFIVLWLLSPHKKKVSIIAKRKFILLLPFLFCLYSFSLIYSQHSGAPYLEKKLLFLLLPLVMGSTQLSTNEILTILRIYVISCLVFTVVSVINAYIFYNLPTEHFSIQHLPHQLSTLLHAPYLSLLLVLSNLSILIINHNKPQFSTTDIVLVIWFSLFILILSSRTALFCNCLLLITYLYIKLLKKNKVILFASILLVILGIICITFIYFPHFQERVTGFSKVGNGISERVTVFQASLTVIKENPFFGVGLGDIQPELNKIYESWNLPKSFFWLNPHNQYLYTCMAIGLPGVFFLIYLLISPLILALRSKEYLLSAFYFIFLFAFLTEVVLARFWGVAAFSFFYTIFTAYLLDQKKETEDRKIYSIDSYLSEKKSLIKG